MLFRSDRRYVILEPSPIHGKDDFEYWNEEFYSLKDDQKFLSDFYNWCMRQDISKYNPRDIPMTQAKMNLIEQNRPRHEQFIIDNIKRFRQGFEKQECFNEYLYWCRLQNITNPGQMKTFTSNLSPYIIWTQRKDAKSGNMVKVLPRKRICGELLYVFQLTDDKYNELAPYADDSDDDTSDDEPVLMRVNE